MKYTAILEGKERELEIRPVTRSDFQVLVDGRSYIVNAQLTDHNRLSLLIGHQSVDISYHLENTSLNLSFTLRNYAIKIMDETQKLQNKIRTEHEISGPEVIKSSMPGKIVKLLVQEDQEVKQGTGIIIIEAMKMENEIKCQNSGLIKKIHVMAGDNVEGNQILVEISGQTD